MDQDSRLKVLTVNLERCSAEGDLGNFGYLEYFYLFNSN